MRAKTEQSAEELIRRPGGLIIVTGPKGSGKSTTLYATLSSLNESHRSIATVERPVERRLPGVAQKVLDGVTTLEEVAGG